MTSRQGEKHEWEFPRLREAHQIPALAARTSNPEGNRSDLWSAKFYPYNEPGVDPIFAVVGGEYILICRPPPAGKENKSVEVILAVEDEDPDSNNYVCAWTKELGTGTPLLCFGGKTAAIKVINALTGELYKTLTGHGGEIEDLQISPINLQILASACEDSTVRIWSLDPAHSKQPCIAILAGDGHRETVLSLSFHANGRYLLSSGIDRIVNLWVLPEFPDENTGTSKPTQIYYPHFSTSEIHSAIVDCVLFYGDLILSKADSEEHIALWAINGFSSTNPPPPPQTAPTTHDGTRDTRSSFLPATSTDPLFTRLLHFSIPEANIMFTRFALFPGYVDKNPILAFCSGASKVFFWDLARLEAYHDYITSLQPRETVNGAAATIFDSSSGMPSHQEQPMKRPAFLIPFRHRKRGATLSALSRVRDTSPTESSSSHHTASDTHPSNANASSSRTNTPFTQAGEKPPTDKDLAKTKTNWAKRYAISDAWTDLAPHKEEVVRGLEFTGRQVAWSTGGEWCVVVGSAGVMALFERWGNLKVGLGVGVGGAA